MSEYLPQEVLIEIFLRLPTKFIIQCTSLSKSWYSLISNPNFISTHLKQNQDEYLLVRRSFGKDGNALFYNHGDFAKYVQLEEFPFEGEIYFNVVGIRNGILCLCSDLRQILYKSSRKSLKIPNLYLWNPSIRKSVKLPNPILGFETTSPPDTNHRLGFGFDTVTNDYKVVRIVHTGFHRVPPQVELFKLSTGVWQDITHVASCCELFSLMPGVYANEVYVNGAFHWLARAPQRRGEDKHKNVIVLFDMHSETFQELEVPCSLVVARSYLFSLWIYLFASEKSLCFIDSSPCGNQSNHKDIDIWMMKDYGDPQSWVKQFSIRLQYTAINVATDFPVLAKYFRKPIALRKNGEIFWTTDDNLLISYDPATGKIKHIDIHVPSSSPYGDAFYVNTYKVSLVLLDKSPIYCVGDTCEESSSLGKREPKGAGGETNKRRNRQRNKQRNRYQG